MPESVQMLDLGGDFVDVPADRASAMADAGYKIPTLEQLQARQAELEKEAKYGTPGQVAKTALEGVAGGLTAGLSTPIETGLGIAAPEDVRARAEVNPLTHGAGEVAGMVAPAVATLGGSLAEQVGVKGAAAAAKGVADLSIPSLITRAGEGVAGKVLGEGAERVAAGTLEGLTAPTIARRGAASAAQLGTESALWSAGDSISEAAVDKDFSAETALLNGGLSTIMGAGLGGVFGAGRGLASELLGKTGEGAFREHVVDALKDFEGRSAIKAAGGIQSDIAKLERQGKDVVELGRGMLEPRPELGGKAIITPGASPELVQSRAQKLIESVGPRMGEVLDQADRSAAEMGSRAARSQAAIEAAWVAGKELPEAVANGKLPEALNFETVAERARRSILDPLSEKVSQRPQAERFARLMGDWEDNFARRAGLPTDQEGRFFRDSAGKILDSPAGDVARIPVTFKDLHSLRQEVDELVYGFRGDRTIGNTALADATHSFRGLLANEIEQGLGAVKSADFPKASFEEWKRLNRTYEVAKTADKLAVKGSERSRGNNLLGLSATLVGSAVGLEHGSAAGLAGGAATELVRERFSSVAGPAARYLRTWLESGAVKAGVPEALAARTSTLQAAGQALATTTSSEGHALIGAIETRNQEVAHRLDVAVRSIFRAGRQGLDVVAPASIAAKAEQLTAENHKKTVAAIAKASDVAALQQRLTAHTEELAQHAPGITTAISMKATSAAQYLAAQVEQHPKRGPLAPEHEPSATEISKLARTVAVLKDPTSILRSASSGMLSSADVAAVRAVYPKLYERMTSSVMDELVRTGLDKIPYATRRSLSTLLGQDLDGTGSLYASSQAVYAASAKQQQAQAPAKSKSANEPNRLMTEAQQTENRRT